MHEGFQGLGHWAGFMAGADRIAMDTHPYMCFGELTAAPIESFIALPCSNWGDLQATSMNGFGLTSAGEWSNAINDCGLYLNAVGEGTRYEGTFETTTRIGSCDQWNNWDQWDQSVKDALKQIMLSSMDALQVRYTFSLHFAFLTIIAELLLLDMENWRVNRCWQSCHTLLVVQAWCHRGMGSNRSTTS